MPWWRRLFEPVAAEWRFQLVLMELEGLSPALLADVGVQNGDVRGFAWLAANGPAPVGGMSVSSPATTIGSAVWVRASLLHLK